jgi:hypothetical protein
MRKSATCRAFSSQAGVAVQLFLSAGHRCDVTFARSDGPLDVHVPLLGRESGSDGYPRSSCFLFSGSRGFHPAVVTLAELDNGAPDEPTDDELADEEWEAKERAIVLHQLYVGAGLVIACPDRQREPLLPGG